MKKFLKYSGLCSLALALVAFILMMATPAIVSTNSDGAVKGTIAIFGGTEAIWGPLAITYKASPMALIGWILGLAGLLVVLAGVVLPLLKIKALEKFSGILSLVAIGLFVAAGVFLFFTVPAFSAATNGGYDDWTLGAGWIIGAILYLVAAAFAALPVVAQILKK